MNKNSIPYIVGMVVALCLVSSALVSYAAIALRDLQQANAALERNTNLLAAAGLIDMTQPGVKEKVPELLQRVETRIINLNTGSFEDDIDPHEYDQLEARKDPQLSQDLGDEDIASIGRREQYGKVYIVKTASGQVDSLVLPVRGYGLWSTMYGFIALESNLELVRGFGFYKQGETPGLGGEVDNPTWKALWRGKRIYDDLNNVALSVVKSPNRQSAAYAYQIDALSGASLTSRGVDNLVKFWLGDMGYGKFIAKVRTNEVIL